MNDRRFAIISGFVLIGLIIIFLLSSIQGSGETVIVDASGNGDFTTIDAAIENATDGDTLLVYDGDYHGNIIINKPLSLIGNGSSTVNIIGGGNNDVIRFTKDNVVVSGVAIMNSGKSPDAAGVEILGRNCIVTWCNISGNNGSGILIKNNGNNTVAHSVLSNNKRYGIVLDAAHNSTIENNTCERNTWVGIMLMSSSKDNIIRNNSCTVGGDSWGILLYSGSNNNRVENNTILSSGYALSLWETTNNSIFNNTMTGSGIDLNYLEESTPDNPDWMIHTIDDSNVLNGRKVYYSLHSSSITLLANMGQIIIINGSNITIEDQNCTDGAIGVTIGYSTNISIVNIDCSNNTLDGIWIISSERINIANSTFGRNQNGIRVEGSSSIIDVHASDINRNSAKGLNASEIESGTVNATGNWWGHVKGPYHEKNNSEGKGNAVTDLVDFQNWIDWPPFDDYETPVAVISLSPDDILKGATVEMEGSVTTATPISTYAWTSSIDGEFYNGSASSFTKYDYHVREHFEGDDLNFNSTGDAPWEITNTESNTGEQSVRSGDISNKETSVLELTVYGMGQLTFYWKVDSEPDYDYLRLYVNDVLEKEISGNIDWTFLSLNFTVGEHTIRWSYEKDDSHFWGEDAGYVDDILFRSTNILSNGTHTISMKVQDEFGIWSADNSTTLVINGRPVGRIESIIPNPAMDVDTIEFKAFTSDDGNVTRIVWASSVDGEFYNGTEPSISNSDLSNGTHTISLRVQDDRGVWSISEINTLIVNGKPIAKIISISPDPALDVESVEFEGNGTDDGSIIRYRWISSIDGEFYNDTEPSFHFDELSNGSHIISMAVKDDMDIWSNEVTSTLTINGKPLVQINEISPNPALDIDDVSMHSIATDDGNITRYVWRSSLDGEFSNGTDANVTIGDLSNGTHTIYLKVQDNNGTWSDEATLNLTINGKPIARIESIDPNPALDRDTITMNGSGSDDGSISRYVWTSSIDGIFHDDTKGGVQTDTLSNGTHTLTFRVMDNDGVWSENASQELIVNGVPVVRITSVSPAPALDVDTIEFVCEPSDDGNITRYVWTSSIDGEIYNGTEAIFSTDAVSNGSHLITLRVLDDFGTWSDSVQKNLDVNGQPRAAIETVGPNPALNIDTIAFNASAHDDGAVVLFVWRSSIDGEIYNGSNSSFESGTLSNGTHAIILRVLDDNDTWSNEETIELIINGKPVAMIESLDPNPALDVDTITFSGSAKDDTNISRYVWKSDVDGVFYDGSNASFTYRGLSNGSHVITFQVQDEDNEWSDDVTTGLTINGKPVAQIESIDPNPAFNTDEVTFEGSGSDDGTVVTYLWISSEDGELYNGNGTQFSTTNLSNGTHLITFRVQDDEGAWSEDAFLVITINGIPVCSIESISPNPAFDTEEVTFKGSGSDDGAIVAYVWISSEDGELYNGSEDQFMYGDLSNGTHLITLRVQDEKGVWSEDAFHVITIRGIPVCSIESISPSPALHGELVSFVGAYVDDGVIDRFVWRSSLDGVLFNGTERLFNHTGLSYGDHYIYFKVLDDQGIWSDEVWAHLHVNERPVAEIESITPNPAPIEGYVDFLGSGSDNTAVVRYIWHSSLNGEIYNGTETTFSVDTLLYGNHTISLYVMDDEGGISHPDTLELRIHSQPQVLIMNIFPADADWGTPRTFTAQVTDDGSVVRYKWESDLDGIFYDGPDTTFIISTLGNGTHEIFLMAQDNDGIWSERIHSFIRVRGRPTAQIIGIDPQNTTEGNPVHFVGRAMDDGVILRYIWNSSIDGTFHDSPTAEFFMNNLSVGLHTITLQVVDDEGYYSFVQSDFLQIFIEPVAEIVSIQKNVTVWGEEIRFEGTGTDATNVTAYIWRSSIDGEFANDSSPVLLHDGLSNGTHIIYLKVLNKYGVESPEVSTSVRVYRKPVPIIDSISPDPAVEGEEVTFTGHGDADDTIVRYYWRSMRDGVLYQGPEATIQLTNLTVGNHLIFFDVMTGHGYWSTSAQSNITVVVSNEQPLVNITSPVAERAVKGRVKVTGTASDPDGTIASVEISIDNGDWIEVQGTDDWTYVWNTKDMINGVHYLKVRSFDGELYSNDHEIFLAVDNEDDDDSKLVAMLLGLIVVILVIGIVLFLAIGRKGSNPEEEKEEPEQDEIKSMNEAAPAKLRSADEENAPQPEGETATVTVEKPAPSPERITGHS